MENKMPFLGNIKCRNLWKIDYHLQVGTSLETIKKIPNKLMIVCGKEKVEVITAALKGGLADSLYIDVPTAEEIVRSNPL